MKIKTFRLFWLNGKSEIVKGTSIADAFTNAGYGAGALGALDYYEEVKGIPMIETKHSKPITYRIYDFLKTRVGRENAISGADLSALFGISRRQLRVYIHEIRNSTELEKVIGSCNRGYFICREEDFDEADRRLERQALSTLKVVWANRKKRSKDGQYKLPLGDYYKEIFKAFGE